MEDYHVSKFVQVRGRELGLFAIYDGHLGDNVPAYLQKHLFSNIIKEVSYFHVGIGSCRHAVVFCYFEFESSLYISA